MQKIASVDISNILGVNEMSNDATATTEEAGKKNVDSGDNLNTIGNDGENDDKVFIFVFLRTKKWEILF